MTDNDILDALGSEVRRLRKELGLSQEKLGHLSDLDRTYVSSLERGLRNVSVLNIVKIASALQTTPSSLLSNLGGGCE